MNLAFRKTMAAGVEVFVRKGTSGRCLVMLHGIGSDHSSFDELSRQLPEQIELIAWNAPGYGESVALATAEPVAKHYADKLSDMVEALGIQHFTLLGHSLGTLIATEYVKYYPEKVDGLILLSCAQGYSMTSGSRLPGNTQQRLTDLDTKGSRVFAQDRAPRLLRNPESKPHLVASAIEVMSHIDPAAYRQAVFMLAAGHLKQSATGVRIDSLTIAAQEDVITPVQQSRDCHEALIAAGHSAKHQYIEIENAGHLVHQEEPEQVAQQVIEFCGWQTGANRGLDT